MFLTLRVSLINKFLNLFVVEMIFLKFVVKDNFVKFRE